MGDRKDMNLFIVIIINRMKDIEIYEPTYDYYQIVPLLFFYKEDVGSK